MGPRRGAMDDQGETLVEVLMAVIILGIAGVAILAGMLMAVKASDIHRKETTGGAYVRGYAEAILNYVATAGTTNYKACAGANYYTPAKVGFTVPTGYTASQSVALSVSATGAASACGTDTGAQLVTLTVASSDNRGHETLAIVVRKPCDPSVAACT